MKRLHIALAVKDLEISIAQYTKILNSQPLVIAKGQYALWRTDEVNLSVSEKPDEAGQLRHLGFEDPEASDMSVVYDNDGFMWERFTAKQQREEILQHYPEADYPEANL
mgnify:CR=1 FL=1